MSGHRSDQPPVHEAGGPSRRQELPSTSICTLSKALCRLCVHIRSDDLLWSDVGEVARLALRHFSFHGPHRDPEQDSSSLEGMRESLLQLLGLALEALFTGPIQQMLAGPSVRDQAGVLLRRLFEYAKELKAVADAHLRGEHKDSLPLAAIARMSWILERCLRLDGVARAEEGDKAAGPEAVKKSDNELQKFGGADWWGGFDVMGAPQARWLTAWRSAQNGVQPAARRDEELAMWCTHQLLPEYAAEEWHADAHMLEKTAAYLQRRNAASQQLKADPQPPFVVHRNRRLSAMANLMQQQQQQQQAPSAAAAVAVRQLHELRELLDPEALAGEPARRCPLCMRRMWDPVRIRSGVDLDRSCFKRWLDRLQQEALPPVCPVTGKPLPARWKGQVPAECEELQRTAAQGWARVWAAAARCADQLSIPAAVGGLPAAPPLPPPLAAQHDANGTAVAPSLPPPPPPPAAGGPSSWADVAGRLRTAAPPAAAELPPPQPELPPASPWTDGRVAVATPQAPGAATAVAAATALPSDAAAAPVEEAWPSVAPTELDAEALDAYGNENSAVPSLESSLPDAASTAGSSDTARHGIHVVAGTHYRPRKELAPVFEAVGESSKLLYTAADARRVFERYIKQEDLEDGPATRPYIELDDALEDALDGVPMKDRPTKKEVFGQLMRKMEPHWLVMRNDKEAIHKGPQPRAVRVSVTMDRWGKTQQGVTEVEGLGNFLVKPEEAVNVLKAALPNRLARVRSITDPRGGGQRTTVQIQGSLVDRVMDILVHRLGMPEKYVSAGDQKF